MLNLTKDILMELMATMLTAYHIQKSVKSSCSTPIIQQDFMTSKNTKMLILNHTLKHQKKVSIALNKACKNASATSTKTVHQHVMLHPVKMPVRTGICTLPLQTLPTMAMIIVLTSTSFNKNGKNILQWTKLIAPSMESMVLPLP